MTNLGPLMFDIHGLELTNEDRECIGHSACGGIILFTRNFQSAEQIERLITSIREIKSNVLISVDQEGGRVQRFKEAFCLLPPLASLGKLFKIQPELAIEKSAYLGELVAMEILSVGCDISFSPVLDLGLEASQIIGDRAFAQDQQTITLLASAFVSGMATAGMAATGKHFPGHGSVIEDSHLTIPVDERDRNIIQNNDMQPFVHLKNQLAGIMPAHIIYSKVDSQPAGFSKIWIQQILRQEIGFEGVVFSDDLSMKGAEIAGDFLQRTDCAIAAGCDMILVCNDRTQTKKVLRHLQNYKMPEQSLLRLSKMRAQTKLSVGLSKIKQTKRWKMLFEQIQTLS